MSSTPTLSTPATPGSTAQRGAAVPPAAPRHFTHVGGTVLFAGLPLDPDKAAKGRDRLRKAAMAATSSYAFKFGVALWEAHDQLAAAYDQALRWRLAGRA